MQSPWWSRPSDELRSHARAFGERAEDLDVNFAQHSRPVLVSAILQRCLSAPDAAVLPDADVWSWTLGQRMQGLLAVAAASGVSQLTASHCCENCGEQLELPVELGGFAREERITALDSVAHEEHSLGIALPTGYDQQRWLHGGAITDRLMARDLVRAVDGRAPAADWHLDPPAVDEIAAVLECHDPLTGLELKFECPQCAASLSMEFDLEALLVDRLRARQWRMLAQVHLLAAEYHWSESDILQLPAWRRRHYLALLGAESDA